MLHDLSLPGARNWPAAVEFVVVPFLAKYWFRPPTTHSNPPNQRPTRPPRIHRCQVPSGAQCCRARTQTALKSCAVRRRPQAEIQKFRNPEIEKWEIETLRNSRVQKCRNLEIQQFGNSCPKFPQKRMLQFTKANRFEILRCAAAATSGNSDIQKSGNWEMEIEKLRKSRVQTFRNLEIQQFSNSGPKFPQKRVL